MEGKEPRNLEESEVAFTPASGSLIGGMAKDKSGRVTDAMADLQLGIDGLRGRLSNDGSGKRWTEMGGGNQWTNALGSFARTCSVFLRKTVLGDRGQRETRLLDDEVLGSIKLKFDRLRKVSRDTRREIEAGFGIAGGFMELTKLDDHTREPQSTSRFLLWPQEFKLSIEWPLPGAADWTGVPSEEAPWPVSPYQLFQTSAGLGLNCDEWLGQQVVLFDQEGISLKKLIQTVVNFEGAHSIYVGRLARFGGETASKAQRDPAPHILNAVTFCGIRYAHLIVIESALYLYDKLLAVSAIERPSGDIFMVTPGVPCSPDQAASPRPDWVQFGGSMMISFAGAPNVIRHKIRAVN